MRRLTVLLGVVLGCVAVAGAVERPSEQARTRVEHHLRVVEELGRHFEALLADGCPRFASPAEWQTYLDGEVERIVLLLAHLDQAWLEAKTTDDDDVRRFAKAPRRRLDDARALLDTLRDCAADNGARFDELALWRGIEQAVPRRQAEIALPQ